MSQLECDRILRFGKGIKQVSYKRADIRLSDHRPNLSRGLQIIVASCKVVSCLIIGFQDAINQHHQCLTIAYKK
ncbi:hypothetical protein CMV_027961 [Castanea mollissima]|uniref:Uncharacterized protein n=1 Tax=Castanea mollissima TaxID=60419 RepID=A0A8J4QEI0_9ROSI|nr:hypothetical protein CMV_027961 [Castanea mollissima]